LIFENVNSIGQVFKVSSFGESHGSHIGCVIDGCPAGLVIDRNAIQAQVNRRRTHQTLFASGRIEEDEVNIISGVFEDRTTGSPITILIKNKDAHSEDYESLKDVYRPNHADYTYDMKYGFRDHRGGGRSSVRVTAALVAAGEIAYQLLNASLKVKTIAYVSQIGDIALAQPYDHRNLDLSSIDSNELRCPDQQTANKMSASIEEMRVQGDTLGGVIYCLLQGVPAGFGEPLFSKLQAELAKAMLSINSVKGFDYGYGFESASMKGSQYNDVFETVNDQVKTITNFSGGIQGGISNGMDIYFRVAFKPISSIQKEQNTVNTSGEPVTVKIGGRHDACAVPRAVPIVEAYANLVLADAFLLHKLSSI
jgi:chorismate synthase